MKRCENPTFWKIIKTKRVSPGFPSLPGTQRPKNRGENQWGFEVSLHEFFLACPCRTDDPAKDIAGGDQCNTIYTVWGGKTKSKL